MEAVTLQEIDPVGWDAFVDAHPSGSIFHHSAWLNVINQTYGFSPFYHQLIDPQGHVRAAIPSVFVNSFVTGKHLVSYPFSDSCDPLVQDAVELDRLLQAVNQTRKDLGAKYIEIRFSGSHTCVPDLPTQNEYVNFDLSLCPSLDTIFASFHKSCIQRSIRKAERQDIHISEGSSREDWEGFYRLQVRTRKKHGTPVQPFRFFMNVRDHMCSRGMASLFLARNAEHLLAGIVLLFYKDKVYYKFGASDERFLSSRANQLLMWWCIQYAKSRGFLMFNFGKTSCVNESLSTYKNRWTTQVTAMPTLYHPANRKSSALHEKSLQHRILKRLLKISPEIIVRYSGNLLYRELT